jgi:hypothetical protein
LSERSLPLSEIHGIAVEIDAPVDVVAVIVIVVLDQHIDFIAARLLDVAIPSRSTIQRARRLRARDAFHRRWQLLFQIWALNIHRKEKR